MRLRQSFALLLVSLSLLAQASLPLLHAQNWAARSGDQLAYLFCGKGSAAALAKFRALAPPELLSQLAADSEPGLADCPLCVLLSALGTLAAASAVALLISQTHISGAARQVPRSYRASALRAYLSRAPPQLS